MKKSKIKILSDNIDHVDPLSFGIFADHGKFLLKLIPESFTVQHFVRVAPEVENTVFLFGGSELVAESPVHEVAAGVKVINGNHALHKGVFLQQQILVRH